MPPGSSKRAWADAVLIPDPDPCSLILILILIPDMAELLGDLTRTHTCGALRADDVGADATLLGWVHRVRDLGGVTFIDVRDRAGISQVVVRDNDALMAVAKRLRSEYVVGVLGVVQRRSNDTVNQKIATGEVEVLAREIRVLNEAKTPPFQIADEAQVSEDG